MGLVESTQTPNQRVKRLLCKASELIHSVLASTMIGIQYCLPSHPKTKQPRLPASGLLGPRDSDHGLGCCLPGPAGETVPDGTCSKVPQPPVSCAMGNFRGPWPLDGSCGVCTLYGCIVQVKCFIFLPQEHYLAFGAPRAHKRKSSRVLTLASPVTRPISHYCYCY